MGAYNRAGMKIDTIDRLMIMVIVPLLSPSKSLWLRHDTIPLGLGLSGSIHRYFFYAFFSIIANSNPPLNVPLVSKKLPL
jgi:hypothetical protein